MHANQDAAPIYEFDWSSIQPFIMGIDRDDTKRKYRIFLVSIALIYMLYAIVVTIIMVTDLVEHGMTIGDYIGSMVGTPIALYVISLYQLILLKNRRLVFMDAGVQYYPTGYNAIKLNLADDDILCVQRISDKKWSLYAKNKPRRKIEVSAVIYPHLLDWLFENGKRYGEDICQKV